MMSRYKVAVAYESYENGYHPLDDRTDAILCAESFFEDLDDPDCGPKPISATVIDSKTGAVVYWETLKRCGFVEE
jgi:hypothetical protein